MGKIFTILEWTQTRGTGLQNVKDWIRKLGNYQDSVCENSRNLTKQNRSVPIDPK